MNAKIKTASLETVDDVMEAADAWQAGDPTREYKVRRTSLGNTCTLYERGIAIVNARGQGGANAIANALEELDGLVAKEEEAAARFDAQHGVRP
jgi:hypothetical protein